VRGEGRGRGRAACLALVASAALAFASASCGAGGDADGGPDADVSGCTMRITANPAMPNVGDTVDIDGSIDSFGVSGLESYVFTVTRSNSPVTLTERDPFDGSKMSFDADVAGTYRIELRGDQGGVSCTDDVLTLNAVDPGAATALFRFRFVTGLAQPAPPQDKLFEIPGGADYSLSTIGLDSGVARGGLIRDDGGQLTRAYLRFTNTDDGSVIEAFAGTDGRYDVRLLPGSYDLLVVPQSGGAPPTLYASLSTSNIGDLTLAAGEVVTGTVVDGAGQPLVGAQVAMRAGAVPTTIGVTDLTGAFAVTGQLGGATAISVTPPAGSGLPRLDLPASAGLIASAGTPLEIRYAASGTSRTVDTTLTETDGTTPLPGASATFVARSIAAAGTVTPQGGSAVDAAGELRATAESDGAGAISVALPEAVYDLIVRPPAASSAAVHLIAGVDLSAGQPSPSALAVAAPATLGGRVVDTAGLEGSVVRAAPRGLLASEPGAAGTAIAIADGSYSVAVVGGARYDLTIDPAGSFARAVVADVTAPAPGDDLDLGAASLDPAIAVSGAVVVSGAPVRSGITVQVFCGDCTGGAALVPLAESITDADGRFTVALPDPEGGS
jgi:hypothetical protein